MPGSAKRACPPDEPGCDLWGRPPARLVTCHGCGEHAEPWDGRWCWRCSHDGQRELVLRSPVLTADDRKRLLTGCRSA